MSETNAETLRTYDQGVDAYIRGTVQETGGHQKEWLDFVFQDVPTSAKILEIGSAFGRDAMYLRKLGYEPDLTDGSDGFVDYLNQHGFVASKLDIVKSKPDGLYDVILACAVLLHFDEYDFRSAVLHIKEALSPDGKFAFSVKQGEGESWSEDKMGAPRFFHYWQPDRLKETLAELGLGIDDFRILSDGKWLHVVSRRVE